MISGSVASSAQPPVSRISFALNGPSAYFCKHPPQQFSDDTAAQMVEEYIADTAIAAE